MKLIKAVTFLLGAMLLLGSCVKEELGGEGRVEEGEQTLLKLSLNASFQNETPETRAVLPESEENKFKDIRVIVFKPTGQMVTNSKTVYPTATSKPDLTIHTYSGNNRTVYIIANVVDEVDKKLSVVQNLTQLNAIQATNDDFESGFSGKPLAMIGSKVINISPGASTVTPAIQMQFMAVKISLKVVDATPVGHTVTLLGWDVENVPRNTFLILNGGSATRKDANDAFPDDDKYWFTTTNGRFPFEPDPDPLKKIAYMNHYVFENRLGVRVNRALPPDAERYPGMSFTDKNDKGKAWFAPKRATCIVIHALHATPTESKVVEARIYFGNDNFGDYNLARGVHYTFTVTVNGINDINIDTNLKPTNGSFAVTTPEQIDKIDAHPDFRPVMISGSDGVASIEILDENGLSHDKPGFAATWVKVSPLNLMYHQVKQAGTAGDWQQVGEVGTFVRAKYIPHRSVRTTLSGKGGWNTIPTGKENDDAMTFGDATHRMCYKITEIPFPAGAVTNKTVCIYADEFLNSGGTRSAKIKISFKKNGSPGTEEKPIMIITQNGYISIYEESNPHAGLEVLNIDGTPSGVKKKFGVERYEEAKMRMNPGIPPEVQGTTTMQWGDKTTRLYNQLDQFRNGYYLTAHAVYRDVTRSNNQPSGFGIAANSYRPMYGRMGETPIGKYTGTTQAPYYHPVATAVIYHPIYKSSAARYCHEKNRDMNGDGFIDASETKWYLPSQHELQMVWLSGDASFDVGVNYWSSTEAGDNASWFMILSSGYTTNEGKIKPYQVRCVRTL